MPDVSIPLPDDVYAELCGEAERSQTPAQDVALMAIQSRLRHNGNWHLNYAHGEHSERRPCSVDVIQS